jgi:hypothetical protein
MAGKFTCHEMKTEVTEQTQKSPEVNKAECPSDFGLHEKDSRGRSSQKAGSHTTPMDKTRACHFSAAPAPKLLWGDRPGNPGTEMPRLTDQETSGTLRTGSFWT